MIECWLDIIGLPLLGMVESIRFIFMMGVLNVFLFETRVKSNLLFSSI